MITCDEVIDADAKAKSYDKETKTIPTNFDKKHIVCETKSDYFLLAFLSITNSLRIAVSMYICLKKYKAKQKTVITISHIKWQIKTSFILKQCILKMVLKKNKKMILKIVRVIISMT